MNPVRTREDLYSWLSMADIETEVFGAYVGAMRYFRTHDFAAESRESSYPDDHVLDGGIVTKDGAAYVGPGHFLEHVLVGLAWRLEALADRKGVDLGGYALDTALAGPAGARTAAEKLAHPLYSHLGGEVLTHH